MKKMMIKSLLIIAALSIEFNVNAQENIPTQIKTVAESRSSGHKISKWVTDKQRNKYVAVLSNGAVMEIDMKGKWLRTSTPVPESKLPAPVTAKVKQYINDGYEVDNYLLINDAAEGEFYIVDITSDDDDATVSIDTKGKVLRKESR